MSIDFGSLTGGTSPDTVISPREIFSLLPAKASRYQYLRDVQAEVLTQWFHRRTEKDLTLKMNTGSGKTVVGLLILKSCLNEQVGPALYIAPTPYLVQQVVSEAADLGIEITEDAASPRFRRGKAILVANIYKLINGKSAFGVGQEGIKIPLGSIVIDDAHACLATSEDQFALTLPASHDAYKKLFSLFEHDLTIQSAPATMDIQAGDPTKSVLVPYWAWYDKQKEVLETLHAIREDEVAKFAWPLLVDHLPLCECVFGGDAVEITPRCLPISMIPSFANARRRVLMSAAFADDGILISDFNVSPEAVEKPINPSSAGDIGDRMILVPQELNPDITDAEIKAFCKKLSARWNVVVLVPSEYRARFWSNVADRTLTAGNLLAGVEDLKQGHVGLVILVNKYDGIDLPNDSCRILVVDGLPDVRKKIDKVQQGMLHGSNLVISQSMQRIEQGMGRGIRSNEDYCVVFLMGRSLTSTLYFYGAIEKFTPATRAQLDLSERLSEQLRGQSMDQMGAAIMYCLNRDRNWVSASRAATVHVRYSSDSLLNKIAVQQRRAFNAATTKDYATAMAQIQESVNEEPDPQVRGWLLQQLAAYQHPQNPVEAQVIQRSAVNLNNQVTRPLEGIQYVKMPAQRGDQATQCIAYLRERYSNPNKLVLEMSELVDGLIFQPDTASRFERSLAQVARLIGFNSQRPEADTGRGPDVLWSIGGLQFLVIEGKNGATTETISKHDCNQLTGSMNWFASQYDTSCSAVPVVVHPSNVFERAGTPHAGTRVITTEKLAELREALRAFVVAVSQLPQFGTPEEVGKLLDYYALSAQRFVPQFTVQFRVKP